MSRSRAISPGTLAPASMTSASASSGAASSVSGTPTRLFRFPVVACTRYCAARAARIISLVLVLPLDPVTATTGLPGASSRRRARARAPRATRVSSTSKYGNPSRGGVPRRTTAAAAPLALASARKSCASKRSPSSATNRSPGSSRRVSVEMPGYAARPGSLTASTSATRLLVHTSVPFQLVARSAPHRKALSAHTRARAPAGRASLRCAGHPSRRPSR